MAVTTTQIGLLGNNTSQTVPAGALVVQGNNHAPTADAAATLTLSADTLRPVKLGQIIFSYAGSGTLAGGNIKIESPSGTTVLSIDVESKGLYSLIFSPAIESAPNTAMIVTLAAGGSNVSGKLFVNPFKIG